MIISHNKISVADRKIAPIEICRHRRRYLRVSYGSPETSKLRCFAWEMVDDLQRKRLERVYFSAVFFFGNLLIVSTYLTIITAYGRGLEGKYHRTEQLVSNRGRWEQRSRHWEILVEHNLQFHNLV